MQPPSLTGGLLVALAVAARLFITVHAVGVVSAVNTIVLTAPPTRSPKLQFSVCGGVAVIAHPATAGVSAHVTPPPTGNMSVTVTLFAVPSPALVNTIVKVSVSPAVMVVPSGVFRMWRFGAWQVITPPSLLSLLDALPIFAARLFITVHAVGVVSAVSTIVLTAPPARSPKLQFSV